MKILFLVTLFLTILFIFGACESTPKPQETLANTAAQTSTTTPTSTAEPIPASVPESAPTNQLPKTTITISQPESDPTISVPPPPTTVTIRPTPDPNPTQEHTTEPTPAPSPKQNIVLATVNYVNTDKGFSVDVPEGWIRRQVNYTYGISIEWTPAEDDDFNCLFGVSVLEPAQPIPLEDFISDFENQFGYYHENDRNTINPHYLQIEFQGKISNNDFVGISIFMESNDRFYRATGIVKKGDYDNLLPLLEDCVTSLNINI